MSERGHEAMHPYELAARLVEYPGPDLTAVAEAARAGVETRDPRAAAGFAAFAEWAAGVTTSEAEELYTRTFDLAAPVCLEVGWHLFADTYKRGGFLVKLRVALREHGIDEGHELPDHLPSVLRLLARLTPEEDPRGLVDEVVLPALAQMLTALVPLATKKAADGSPAPANPFRAVLGGIASLLAGDFALTMPAPEPHRTHLPVASAEVEP